MRRTKNSLSSSKNYPHQQYIYLIPVRTKTIERILTSAYPTQQAPNRKRNNRHICQPTQQTNSQSRDLVTTPSFPAMNPWRGWPLLHMTSIAGSVIWSSSFRNTVVIQFDPVGVQRYPWNKLDFALVHRSCALWSAFDACKLFESAGELTQNCLSGSLTCKSSAS